MFAGGIYYCSQGDLVTAFTQWLSVGNDKIDVPKIIKKTEEFEAKGLIDSLDHLRGKRVFIFTGTTDVVVPQTSSKKLEEFMKHFDANVNSVWDVEWAHSFPNNDFGNERNELMVPFINNWNYKGAYEEMSYLYYGMIKDSQEGFVYQNIFKFDQSKYISIPGCMHQNGYAYVPTKCQSNSKKCHLHVVLHGWLQTYDHIGLDMMVKTHYNELAEKNNIIMLYPQSVKSLGKVMNPRGCFDWWGYCDGDKINFATKEGPQIKAIMNIIKDFQNGKLELEIAREEIFKFTKWENIQFYEKKDNYPIFPSDY